MHRKQLVVVEAGRGWVASVDCWCEQVGGRRVSIYREMIRLLRATDLVRTKDSVKRWPWRIGDTDGVTTRFYKEINSCLPIQPIDQEVYPVACGREAQAKLQASMADIG